MAFFSVFFCAELLFSVREVLQLPKRRTSCISEILDVPIPEHQEICGKAVIACMHGAVLGAGLELVSACDIRFCTEDAAFQLAEVNIGLASDVGGLQRLPKIIGNQKLEPVLAAFCDFRPGLYFGLSSEDFVSEVEALQA